MWIKKKYYITIFFGSNPLEFWLNKNTYSINCDICDYNLRTKEKLKHIKEWSWPFYLFLFVFSIIIEFLPIVDMLSKFLYFLRVKNYFIIFLAFLL